MSPTETTPRAPHSQAEETTLTGGGELGALMRQKDWSATPLGPMQSWPRALKTAVRILLTSRQPMFVWWGEELINLYNDAYTSVLGGKHPQALGQPAAVVWREIWDEIGPRAHAALAGDEGTYDEALLLIMERNGYPEETYYTFSYSPMPNDEGGVGGIFCANTDDTQRIIGERQLALLQDLAIETVDARAIADACTLSARSLETNPRDLPFALIYLLDSDHRRVVLAGTAGLAPGHHVAPATVALNDASVWPFAEVVRASATRLIPTLDAALGDLPTGAWDRPPTQAVALPITPSGQTGQAGVLIVGLNPYRLFDDSYKGFLGLVSGQIAAAIANAQAYEEERKRAEALAEIDRAKTLFFSNVSHEFRTPLTLMLGPLEEMLSRGNGVLTAERAEVASVHRNGLRLLKLVNTLLDFSRIEAGRMQATYEPTELATLTADLASSFRSAIERAGLRLIVDCPPLPAPVYVDRDMWEKIVLNLLSNAFKFTFEGEIRVGLKTSAEGTSAELTVRDTGTGIPVGELPRLFERFHRIEGARGRTHEGTGIGLALVQELVKLHGGTITVTSELDRGSVFTVRLPFGTAHLSGERIGAASALTSTATRAEVFVEEALRWLPEEGASSQYPVVSRKEEARDWRLGASSTSPQVSGLKPQASHVFIQSSTSSLQHPVPRILLAEDNADMRDYVRRLLSPHYEVTAVADGQEALGRALAQPPDLVLSDVMMPRLDGFGLLRALRHAPRTRTVPVVLLTARAGEEAQIEGLAEGADDYIVKPFNARELLARVGAHVELARLREEATRREQALRQEAEAARDKVTHLLDSMAEGFLAFDGEWRITAANAMAARVTDKRQEELLGANYWELFPATWETTAGKEFRRAMTERVTVEVEDHYPPADRWYDVRAYPLSTGGLSIFFRDITKRKQAEEVNLRLAAVVESSDDAIVSKSLDGIVTSWNAGAERIFGYRTEEMIGQPILRLLPEDRQAEETMILEQLRRGERIDHFETVRQTKDGRLLNVSVTISPLRSERGTIIGASKIARDITARKQAEAERERLFTELQRINDELQQFAHIVSHDLNEPLRTMRNYVQLLARRYLGKLDTDADDYITLAVDGAQRMQQMLSDLLAYTRAGQTPEFQAIDCQAVLAQVLSDLQARITESGAVITHDPLPTVQGDATRIGQVLQNLIGNALKFCTTRPRIHISAHHEDRHWRFAVRDNGIGIDPKRADKLFQVFQRLHSRSEYPGTGMGLAICKKIVEQHGGHIWIESKPGEGATFNFTVSDMRGGGENRVLIRTRDRSPPKKTMNDER